MKTQRHAPLDINELRTIPTVSVERAGEYLGVSRAYAYAMVRAGDMPVIRLGPRRVRVPSAKLLAMLGVDA
ncbi:excisionase family DNA-binding protein [Gordonia malaquae]|uniref:helix-turn-helix transcriptional regulator n=1 Tax=Gordonia malaquae TaxID=410332 RepID=UPI0030FEAAD9